jgi:probable F420-dependent oxidoreductase
MQIDANLKDPALTDAGELARTAEEMGFDGCWSTELTHSPFTLSTRMADQTESMDIGTGIALAFPRSPMVTAYTAWDLQRLSKGRFILGLGTQVKGHIERRFSATWDSPGPQLREYVLAINEIWNSWTEQRHPDFQGDHYSITLCPPEYVPEVPETPQVPIYIAGVNEYNIRVAGELCDGLYVHPLHSPKYVEEEVVPYIREGASRGDRNAEDVVLATSVMAIVGDTEEELAQARESVREEIAFYASTRTYRKILEVHGWGDVCDELHELSVNDEWDRMPNLVSDEMVDAFSIEGSWSDLRGQLNQRYEYIDRVAVYRPFDGESEWEKLVR